MRRKAVISLAITWMLVGGTLAAWGREAPKPALASLKAVTATGEASSSQIMIEIAGDYSYQTANQLRIRC